MNVKNGVYSRASQLCAKTCTNEVNGRRQREGGAACKIKEDDCGGYMSQASATCYDRCA